MRISFWAESLSKDANMTVLLPEKSGAAGPYPVLYLLHGMSQDDSQWSRLTRIERYVVELPLIVVMPDGGRGYYTDAKQGLAYESHVMKDVIGFVDRFFPTIPERRGRAIGGYSMGGYGAVKLAFKHPDCFCSVVGSAGPYDLSRLLVRPDCGEEMRLIFGDDVAEGGNDIFRLAEGMDRGLLPVIRLECGTEDYLLPDSRKLHAHLGALGISHEYAELPGAHSLSGWDPQVPAGVEFHVRALRAGRDSSPPRCRGCSALRNMHRERRKLGG